MSLRPALALLTLALLALAAPAASFRQTCSGCIGSATSASASGGLCGGTVSVSISVTNGTCKWVISEDGIVCCRQILPCNSVVTRTWSNLTPGSALELCVTSAAEGRLCVPSVKDAGLLGAGIDTRLRRRSTARTMLRARARTRSRRRPAG
jgi:hypothetical protein